MFTVYATLGVWLSFKKVLGLVHNLLMRIVSYDLLLDRLKTLCKTLNCSNPVTQTESRTSQDLANLLPGLLLSNSILT